MDNLDEKIKRVQIDVDTLKEILRRYSHLVSKTKRHEIDQLISESEKTIEKARKFQ